MSLNLNSVRQYLRAFDFKKLFIEELGWDHFKTRLDIPVDGQMFALTAVAQKRGFQVFVCESDSSSHIPDHATRRKIEKQVTKSAHEHLIVYVDAARTSQVWQWVRREPGKPAQSREHTYRRDQPGDALIQKLQALQFTLEEEEMVSLPGVASRVRAGFDVERVTKRFYDRFKSEHAAFLKFLKGIPDEDMQRWYLSVMLNRLMFIYFIQKKRFLNDDQNYLRTRLAESRDRGKDHFYRDFLCPLFFEGFAKKPQERSQSVNKLLGNVPYLNGGLFLVHQIEEAYGKDIQIGDGAFENLFSFFEQYEWHLDERPRRADNEINPDVLGYIFEKYINQKQMGAYYTKEDITGYISQNTVIPFLFDAAQKKCKIAFQGEQSIWRLLQADPDRYIYEAVRRGVTASDGKLIPETVLPDFVQKGMCDPKARMFDKRYNLGEAVIRDADGNNLALPTETWREYVERRNRCSELRNKLSAGEIRSINDLITYNLDIRQFAQDVIENSEGPELLRAFYHAIEQVTVLDPACGSGAFLFAALNILEPLYEACLDRMESFLEDLERSGEKHRPEKFGDFRKILDRVAQHPNRRYFILKSIILNNLYGVDIMEEATEICKLRLFLKLVAQIDDVGKIEPLPDIDFNIRAGNSLVGYATYEDVKHAVSSKLDFEGTLGKIQEKAQDVDRLFALFRQQQTEIGGEVTAADKDELRKRLSGLEDQLNRYLAGEYGIKPADKAKHDGWLASHKPFHWFVEFHSILSKGGFDSSIGNPPYVEYKNVVNTYGVKGFETLPCGDLYALVLERSVHLLRESGRLGMITPVSIVGTDGFQPLRSLLKRDLAVSYTLNFAERPSKLFTGVEKRLSIWLGRRNGTEPRQGKMFSSDYRRWFTEERDFLFFTERLTNICERPALVTSALPKVNSQVAVNILNKLKRAGLPLGIFVAKAGTHRVYYTRKLRYFVQFFLKIPRIEDEQGRTVQPSELKELEFAKKQTSLVVAALLNSNLFFWFFSVYSDVRNVNRREIEAFPADLPTLEKRAGEDLAAVACELMNDFDQNSETLRIDYGDYGVLKIQAFQPRLSKPIIDKIDCVLAKHYGFTDEELDFIINFDIKYRLGRSEDEQEEALSKA